MSTLSATEPHPETWDSRGKLWRFIPLAIYVVFAAFIYVVHGAEPPLSIDHISYFKLADEIRVEWPNGDYYKTINAVRAYGVILAYLYDYTGSHVTSLKVLLAILTVAYLAAFQLYITLATRSRRDQVLFALLSALFVSFGASIWGMTDFAASLNRTLIIPFVVLLVWGFFRYFDSGWRYAIFPALVLLSVLHLSAIHVALVFAAFEVLDFVLRRRFRFDRNLIYLLIAFIASVSVQFAMEKIGAGTANFVRYTLNVAVPAVPTPAEAPKAPAVAAVEPAAGDATAPKAAEPPPPPTPTPSPPKPPDRLTPHQAWDIELFAFPWRNMPPSFATLATIGMSFGFILILAIAGATLAFRSGAKRLDRLMVFLAFGVLLAAYGLQTLLWVLRNTMGIFPVNFEEIRAVNNLMFPAVYFVYRLYELVPSWGRFSRRAMRTAVVLAFALQPIVLVRALPLAWREGIVETAIEAGAIKSSDAPRVMYARHFVGLSHEGRRFYYSARPAIQWLEKNSGPDDLVLTNVNEFIMLSRAKTTGTFLGVVSMDVWDLRRGSWIQALDSVDRLMATRDTENVKKQAREVGATYVVVPWQVEGAAYRDQNYSILRMKDR